ncbi:MAG: Asp-tRNA(Asn)/Glu-tRNA(Gln) amidotransferase subunit GatA [Eubacterium sp.]|jgi:aspartyl-tRNA(Asn)/glutamyl-tRNA(Gln) amidotransferase subunit A|nr:Asp-tRNA(Asn)/Glu-tRNA(Gln) amidotransferase subunit GatA [Eubacterium sp.]
MNNIKELREKLDKKEISATDLVKKYLEKIKENPSSYFVTVTEEMALESAKFAQKIINEGRSGLLTGIPAAIKDNICTDGIKTSCGSKMLENFIPPYDAAVIEKLKSENYIMLGKSAMSEFAAGKSPENEGGAYAVSEGLCAFALSYGSSVDIGSAAEFYGLTGLAPSFGRVSRFGVAAFSSSFGRTGPITNSAHDCGSILSVISGYDSRDVVTKKSEDKNVFNDKVGMGVKGLKIFLPKEIFDDETDETIKSSVICIAKEFEKLGATLIDGTLKSYSYADAAYYLLSSAEASSNLARYDGIKYGLRGEGKNYDDIVSDSRTKGFGEEVKRRIMFGNFALAGKNFEDYYLKALAVKQQIKKEVDNIFEKADIIISPVLKNILNLTGHPVITLPCGRKTGVSLMGKMFGESVLIGAADAFERR